MNPSLPSGTVTFCFTDIEGSTRAFAKLGPRFLDVLEEHRRIVRDAVAEHGGAEVKTEGDGFFLAFDDAHRAVSAAIAFQRALAAHDWPDGGEVRVRAGLHVGEAEPVDDDYLAFSVHEAARVADAAHGGQTVISQTLADALEGRLPAGVTLRDLGTHELKDISPVRIHQLCHPDLPDDFPPLRSASGVRGYLPTPTSSLVGREAEVADLVAQVRSARLVTVTGAGGVGKTRIAVEAARAALGSRPDGVWFVDLAPVTDPSWIADAVLAALGVVRFPEVTAREQLLTFLAASDALLVIDNCEHMIDACSALAEAVLTSCPKVSIVATSREPLGIQGEVAWRLRSLDPSEGVNLFIERAKLVVTDFVIDDTTRTTIEQIVERVDGIPLAIELAAARTRVLTPAQISERLDDRFRLLTGGSRTAIARQRTLEATVDWSYGLLEDEERQLLRALSVFVGGFSIDAAEAVGGFDALDLLERLVDKSLIGTRLVGDQVRYRLLETIRHYAWLKLIDAGGMQEARDRHLAYIADLVERIAAGLRDERESRTAETLTLEQDNVRAALDWALATGGTGSALRIVSEMWMYWAVVGRVREAVDWLDRVLAVSDGADPERLAQLHAGAAHMTWLAHLPNDRVERHARAAVDQMRSRDAQDVRWYDAFALSRLAATVGAGLPIAELSHEAVERARRCGDGFILADVLQMHSLRVEERDGLASTLAIYDEAVKAARRSGASSVLAYALDGLSGRLAEDGEIDRAVAVSQQALTAARRGPNVWFACFALNGLGAAKALRGDDDAADYLRETIAVADEADLDMQRVYAETELGWLELANDRPDDARTYFEHAGSLVESVTSSRPELLFQWGFIRFGIAETFQAQGDLDEARARLRELVDLAESATGLRWTVAQLHNAISSVELEAGDIELARRTYERALRIAREAGQSAHREAQSKAASLRGLAAVALAERDAVLAAELAGAASHVFEPNQRSGRVNIPRNVRVVATAREQLGDDAFAAAWGRGYQLGLDQVLVAES